FVVVVVVSVFDLSGAGAISVLVEDVVLEAELSLGAGGAEAVVVVVVLVVLSLLEAGGVVDCAWLGGWVTVVVRSVVLSRWHAVSIVPMHAITTTARIRRSNVMSAPFSRVHLLERSAAASDR